MYCLLLLKFPVTLPKKGQLVVQAMSHGPNCSSSGLPGLHELLHHVVSVTIQGDPGKIHGAFCHQRPRKLVSWSMVLSHVFVGTRRMIRMAIECEKWWYFPMGFRAYFDTDQVVQPVALICTSISNILQHDLSVASLKPASMCPNDCRLFLSKWIFHISFFSMTLDGWHLMANQRLIVSKTSKRRLAPASWFQVSALPIGTCDQLSGMLSWVNSPPFLVILIGITGIMMRWMFADVHGFSTSMFICRASWVKHPRFSCSQHVPPVWFDDLRISNSNFPAPFTRWWSNYAKNTMGGTNIDVENLGFP